MFVITSWDEKATIEYIPPEKMIDSGDEDEYFELRPAGLPADENEFIIFEAAQMELVARLSRKAALFMDAAKRIEELIREDVITVGEERHKPRSEQEALRVKRTPLAPQRLNMEQFEEDVLGPQGEDL